MTKSALFCSTCGALIETANLPCPHCGQSEQVDASTQGMPLLRERYQREMLLGSGGFSAVYQARDLLIDERVVAIKEITLQGLSADEIIEATETFNREVQLLSTLTHAQVPALYEHFSDQEHWYLVLEYIEGQTLEDFVDAREAQRRPLTLDEILAIAVQLCSVLEYLHARQPPIVFRDLKPSNIMRTPAGSLYLIDFGIARYYRPGQQRDTRRLGSPGYAAPEQYGRAQSTPRSDIYSLGALLRFLLSGQNPADKQLSLSPLRLNGQPGSTELESLVARMLSPDPDSRPASMHEIAAILQTIREQSGQQKSASLWHPPIPQTPPALHHFSSGQQHMHTARQAVQASSKDLLTRRKVLIGLGALTAAGVGITLGVNLGKAPEKRPAHIYQTYAYIGRLYTGRIAHVEWSPNSTFLASVSYENNNLQIWNTFDNSHTLTYEPPTPASSDKPPAWSPDSKYIAFCGNGYVVEIWDIVERQLVQTCLGHMAEINRVSWSPDGTLLASASDDRTVKIWDATTGATVLTYIGHINPVRKVAWSSDGKYIASFDQSTLSVWTTSGQDTWSITGDTYKDRIDSWEWSPDARYLAISSGDLVMFLDAGTGQTVSTYHVDVNYPTEIAWSPDGKRIASLSENKMQIWNTGDGSTSWDYQGHRFPANLFGNSSDTDPNGIAWSPDNQYIATSGDDKVQIWNAKNGSKILNCVGDAEQVWAVTWSPNGKRVAAAGLYMSGDTYINMIQMWQVS